MNCKLSKSARLRLEPGAYQALRKQLLHRDAWRCQWCGTMSNLEVHHRQFRSRCGDDLEQNLITLCSACHSSAHRARTRQSRTNIRGGSKGRWHLGKVTKINGARRTPRSRLIAGARDSQFQRSACERSSAVRSGRRREVIDISSSPQWHSARVLSAENVVRRWCVPPCITEDKSIGNHLEKRPALLPVSFPRLFESLLPRWISSRPRQCG